VLVAIANDNTLINKLLIHELLIGKVIIDMVITNKLLIDCRRSRPLIGMVYYSSRCTQYMLIKNEPLIDDEALIDEVLDIELVADQQVTGKDFVE
jgi:hypothetical protein